MTKEKYNWKEVGAGLYKSWGEVGDMVEGELIEKLEGQGNFNSRVYSIKQENGDVIKVNGTAVLDSRFTTIGVGDIIRIVFNGTQPSKAPGRNDTKLFSVFVTDPAEEPSVQE